MSWVKILILLIFLGFSGTGKAFVASKVYFTFLPNGTYRVSAVYTVPELREARESHALFRSKKKAEAYYWKLVRGADFYPGDAESAKFNNRIPQPEAW